MPFEDQSFDTVVSFQVIEHVFALDTYLSEIRRVLKPGGVVVIATPDRETRLFSFQKPWNRYHLTEFSHEQLGDLMYRFFDGVEVLGMSGDSAVVGLELRRTNRMKWVLLPVTLPFVPEAMRRAGLAAAKRAMESMRGEGKEEAKAFDFDESAIEIGAHSEGCTNLIAVGKKRTASVPETG